MNQQEPRLTRRAKADGGPEALTCQGCHMARADGVKIANRPRRLAARDDFARHGFYGGNTLLQAAGYLKDNRIPPRGSDKGQAPAGVAVVGGALQGDADFAGGSDLVTYRIQVPAGVAGAQVSAELNYQTLAYGFLADLATDADDPRVARFLDLYAASSVRAETIADTSVLVENSGPAVEEPPVTDPGTGDGSDTGSDTANTGSDTGGTDSGTGGTGSDTGATSPGPGPGSGGGRGRR